MGGYIINFASYSDFTSYKVCFIVRFMLAITKVVHSAVVGGAPGRARCDMRVIGITRLCTAGIRYYVRRWCKSVVHYGQMWGGSHSAVVKV
jgi:hypothetical protein